MVVRAGLTIIRSRISGGQVLVIIVSALDCSKRIQIVIVVGIVVVIVVHDAFKGWERLGMRKRVMLRRDVHCERAMKNCRNVVVGRIKEDKNDENLRKLTLIL